jgi:tRNA U34 5-carboxymethylaminomethyl modifying enzyme MnmG/GidA
MKTEENKEKRSNGEIQYNINLLLGMPNKVFDFGLNKDKLLYLEELIKALSLKEEEATKQAEKRFIEKVSSISLEDFDKFIDKLKSELNCSLPSNFDCDETALKVVDNLASELKQKLTNHTPKETIKSNRR